MAKRRLNRKDIQELASVYRAERRRLIFQLDRVRTALKDLKRTEAALPKETPKPNVVVLPSGEVKRRPGRPRKGEVVQKRAKRGPGRPPKRVIPERPLNEWDNAVIGAIKTRGQLLPKEDILEHVTKWASVHQPSMKKGEVEQFVTRALQKLTDRKKMLGTHRSGLRRGYHYGLKQWFFQSSGKLRRQHYDKLILTKD